jgi:type I restriction enzyme S subunit
MARNWCAGKTTSGGVSEVRAAPIALPPLSLQRDFARRVAAVEKLKTAHRASLVELDALFASLQHRAFRGEL